MTIGEKLEEARKRKGISIGEVADATKIRSEYLASMEDNSMEIALPEIYRRGFLRNYAIFLKLDPDKIMTDYDAQFRGSAVIHRERSSASEDRPVYGRMELPSDEAPAAPRPEGDTPATRQEPPARPTAILTDNTLYLKIAAGLAGAALVVLLVFLLVWLLGSGDSSTVQSTQSNDPSTTESAGPAALRIPDDPTTMIFRAVGGDVTLIVENIITRERLFRGILNEGNVQQVEKDGPLLIKYSSGNFLSIEYTNGLTVPDLRVGMGQINLP
jgi:transcriptional regulator with XRE-family HTH domain|tara:strand:- start:4577 stop:5389 length:813 start_codon:yes stop_codon:yes gene_type:complete